MKNPPFSPLFGELKILVVVVVDAPLVQSVAHLTSGLVVSALPCSSIGSTLLEESSSPV